MGASTDGGGECRGANIRSSPSEGVNASNRAEGGTFDRLGGLGFSRKGPGCLENVLVEVLMERLVVLVENMCVGGTLKTFS